jgi:hypothetical protein
MPTVPAGRGEVLSIASDGGLIESVNALFVVALVLSDTWTVKLKVPAFVGVPLNTPAVLKLVPPGNAPEMTDQLKGPVPFVTMNVNEYGLPTVPLGNGEVEVMAIGADADAVNSTTSVAALAGSSFVAKCRAVLPMLSDSLIRIQPWLELGLFTQA